MNHSMLVSFYRSLSHHRLHAALNIGGLALGIAAFLTLGLYVRYETSFEHWLPDYRKIYAVQTVWSVPGNAANGAYPYTMGGLLEQMRDDMPGTVGTRIRGGDAGGSVRRGSSTVSENVAQVDPSFFDVFALPMVSGDGSAVLQSPANILLSESTAKKYFGQSDPIGQMLMITVDAPSNYRVAGVFRDLPSNTELDFSILMPLPRTPPSDTWFHWGSAGLRTYLRFETPDAAQAFTEKLHAFVDRRGFNDLGKDAWSTQQLALLPLDRLHLEPEGPQSASRKMTVATLGLVGVLTLLIAVLNYVNLAAARAGLRAREVAMRKALGASNGMILRQFVSEAMLTVMIAALAGLIIAEASLPLINAAGGLSLTIAYPVVIPGLIVLTLVVGPLAGMYPAILLARFPAAEVLASARAPGGGRAGSRVREALVAFQFAVAIAFMIGTAVLVVQTDHVRRTDLGFKREGMLVIPALGSSALTPAQRRSVAAALRTAPGVTGVALGNGAVGSGDNNSDNISLPGVAGEGPSIRSVITGPGYFQVYGARLLAGRLFDDAHGSDESRGQPKGQPRAVVINRSAVPVLGFRSPADAIGKTVGGDRPRTIIGVVDDMRFYSPREPVGPVAYRYYREPEEATDAIATVRFSGDPRLAVAAARNVWRRIVPQIPFDGMTAERKLTEFYEADDRATKMFGIGAGLAILIGCLGVWGLASFSTARRVKEIGIRKTLGASSADIVRLLVGQFLRPVLLANLLGWPLAFFATRAWLAGFDDRIALSPLFFISASVFAVVIAVLTVIGQSLRASRAAPAWALRHD